MTCELNDLDNEKYALKVRDQVRMLRILSHTILNATDVWSNESLYDGIVYLKKYGFHVADNSYSDKLWTENLEMLKIQSIEKDESVYDMYEKLDWLIDRYVDIATFNFKKKDIYKFLDLWQECYGRCLQNIRVNLLPYKAIL